MDQLDAEHILFHWYEASEDDRRAAALYGVYELDSALTELEADVPVIAEKVCSGLADVRDFPPTHRGAYRCGEAILSWIRTYPDLEAEWKALGRRAVAVLSALDALDPAVD
jgi:hypothetical protein